LSNKILLRIRVRVAHCWRKNAAEFWLKNFRAVNAGTEFITGPPLRTAKGTTAVTRKVAILSETPVHRENVFRIGLSLSQSKLIWQ